MTLEVFHCSLTIVDMLHCLIESAKWLNAGMSGNPILRAGRRRGGNGASSVYSHKPRELQRLIQADSTGQAGSVLTPMPCYFAYIRLTLEYLWTFRSLPKKCLSGCLAWGLQRTRYFCPGYSCFKFSKRDLWPFFLFCPPPWGRKKAVLKGKETQKCYHAINKKGKDGHLGATSICQVLKSCSMYMHRGGRAAASPGILRPFTFSHGCLHQDSWFCYLTISQLCLYAGLFLLIQCASIPFFCWLKILRKERGRKSFYILSRFSYIKVFFF